LGFVCLYYSQNMEDIYQILLIKAVEDFVFRVLVFFYLVWVWGCLSVCEGDD